ncbi:MAG: hypothetical protein AAAB11_07745 [Rhizobium giardinii]|jgi:hypothetical protein
MKSPWKFLAQLTSRRGPAETRENTARDHADPETGESDARQTSALLSNIPESSSSPNDDENLTADFVAAATSTESDGALDGPQAVTVPVDGEEDQAPAQAVSRAAGDARALAPESRTSKKLPRTSRTKRLGSAKRTRADIVSESTAVANSEQRAQSSSSPERFFDEVARLDEEIRQLRCQLARKLYLQNVQLTKMLERFNGS